MQETTPLNIAALLYCEAYDLTLTYFRHLLTELPKHCDNEGNIDPAELDDLLPWSEKLPDECRKPRR